MVLVLSSHTGQRKEKPIAYASRSLSAEEKKYAQLDKEDLSIVFSVKKFHNYAFGRNFEIRTDHKPLEHLFLKNRPIPQLASAHIQHWALTLGTYDYTIEYKPGKKHANTDALSRLPCPDQPLESHEPVEVVLLMETFRESPVTAQDIRHWTDRDQLLSKVWGLIQHGWEDLGGEEMNPTTEDTPNSQCKMAASCGGVE